MGKIEVNEYVRTKKGAVGKLIEIDKKATAYYLDCLKCVSLKNIVKHSKQLIDLIEVKDLVCFKNKLQNSLENEEMIIHIFDNDTLEEVKQAIEKGEIELLEILTHEQFEQSSYKLGGEE